MNRRDLLAVCGLGILSGMGGCFNPAEAIADTTEGAETAHCEGGIVLTDVFPREVERDYISGEYVRLENIANDPIDVTDYTVDYGNGKEFTLPDVEMEPKSALNIISRSGKDTTLQSSPPIYLVFASFGDELDTSVLNGTGSVKLRTPDDDLIDKIIYRENLG